MIIGFGKTEIDLENKIEQQIRNYCELQYYETDISYFDEPFIKNIRSYCDKLAEDSREAERKYKHAAEYPDRYSYIYAHVLGDCSFIAVRLDFGHINRRHAFSPDGWALLKSERSFWISEWDAGERKRKEKVA